MNVVDYPMRAFPRLLVTLGDVAGVGPEVLVKAWPELVGFCRPVVVGSAFWLQKAVDLVGARSGVRRLDAIKHPDQALAAAETIQHLEDKWPDLAAVVPCQVSAVAGRAAFDFLVHAINLTQAGLADAIVTLPLHKEGLHAAGLPYPGHTEILADKTGTQHYGMMLYARGAQVPHGLGVVHVTLHMALRRVFEHLDTAAIVEKIRLLNGTMGKLMSPGRARPRLAVAALNPHASDGGLFGDEEETTIAPAVRQACAEGFDVAGPLPADTLFVLAQRGAFDGIVAMYHDQGHIALKLLSGLNAVNVTLGLPIVRTSVAHGTAYDIAWQGKADHGSLVEAARVATRLAK
jgi:4-hydroxythreonine-4-phosphate dehydrogenase